MSRRLRLQLRASKALYDKACSEAAVAFEERRYQDAIAIYERFAQEHPKVHPEELQMRLHALKDYVTGHVEKHPGASP